MTTNKPATPLPWASRTQGYGEALVYGQKMREPIAITDTGDSAYIAHAANAYPRLVEALREIAGERTQHLRSIQMQDCINRQKSRARALLRELGEE